MTLAEAVTAAGWVRTRGNDDAWAAGMRLTSLKDHAADAAVVGLDIGGTKIHAASWTPAGIEHTLSRTRTSGGFAVVDDIESAVRSLVGNRNLHSLAVGLPGTLDPSSGHLEHAPNLPRWDEFDVPAELSRRFGVPVRIENDVNLAAVGEQAWTGEDSLVFVAIGTGIGVGIMVREEIWGGANRVAGEVYDVPLREGDGDACALEDLVCGPGLARAYHAFSGHHRSTKQILRCLPDDSAATAALAAVTAPLAGFLATVHALLDPSIIVLGGGLGARPEFLDATRGHLASQRRREIPLRSSALGSRASTVGAIVLAARRPAGFGS